MSKRKADCTPEEWARVRERMRRYESQYRKRPDRQQYMKDYMSAYTKTEAYRAQDNARYDDARRERALANHRRRSYNATPELVETLRVMQDRRCAVCGDDIDGRHKDRGKSGTRTREHLDHDHSTGEPRGLLCHHCNRFDGFLNRRNLSATEYARRLEAYLADPPAQRAKQVMEIL